jgi:hypothetical protein
MVIPDLSTIPEQRFNIEWKDVYPLYGWTRDRVVNDLTAEDRDRWLYTLRNFEGRGEARDIVVRFQSTPK